MIDNKEQNYVKDDFDIQACSTTDCTGLIPSLPLSEAEVEAYDELYSYLLRAENKQ